MIDFKLLLKPHCAICNRDVEKIEWEQEFCTMTIYAKAYCHGDSEVATLPQNLILEAQISKGVAFMNKRIETKDKAFDHQVEPQIGLSVEKYTEAKGNMFNKEQELFYRATDYRGS